MLTIIYTHLNIGNINRLYICVIYDSLINELIICVWFTF